MAHTIVSKDEWLVKRKALLQEEKEFIRLKDKIAEHRRALPWVRVEKDYAFDTSGGSKSLAELFADRSQLIVYHFMFGPDWEEGCPGCTQVADTFNLAIGHLNLRDVSMLAVSRAPLERLDIYKQRMGWSFDWVSSLGSDFNFDFEASYRDPELSLKHCNYRMIEIELEENHGVSVFTKDDDGQIYHTYSCYDRAVDPLMVHLQYLDLCPKGRQDDVYNDAARRPELG